MYIYIYIYMYMYMYMYTYIYIYIYVCLLRVTSACSQSLLCLVFAMPYRPSALANSVR